MSARPTIVWFTGLPASGKSTLAARARDALAASRHVAIVLDSDTLHAVLGAHAYATGDRDAFYDTLAALAGVIAKQGVIVLVSATAPRRAHREAARATGCRVVEVWVRTPLAECEARDPKGLYAGARRGDIATLPGIGVAYEPPEHPDVIADGGHDDGAIATLIALVDLERSAIP